MPTLSSGQTANLVLTDSGTVTVTPMGTGGYTLTGQDGTTRTGSFNTGGANTTIVAGAGGNFQLVCTSGTLIYTSTGRAVTIDGYGSGLKSAISAYKRGLRTRPPILFGLGDSNFTGEGAGNGSGTVPKLTQSFGQGPFDQIINHTSTLAGLPIRTTTWFGDGNSANNNTPPSEYNPRLTLGTDWVRTVGVDSTLTSKFYQGNPASAGYLSYNFGSPITNVEVYAVVNATNSAAVGVYDSSNTLVTTINTNGTDAAAQFMVTGNFPDGIVKFKNNGANNCYIAGCIAWNSAEKCILLARGSYSGSTVGNYNNTATAWNGMGFFPAIAPDLTLVSLTINDIFSSTTRANYNTGLSYIADFAVRSGDLVISTGGNGTAAGWTNGTSQGIEAEARIVAAKYGAPFVSMQKEWGSWAATNAIGQEFDGNHRNRAGYFDQAGVYSRLLISMVGR